MKPAPFDYVRPSSVAGAVAALAEARGEAKVLAGGQSLVPLMALRLARPDVVVDLNAVAGLDTVEVADGRLRLGAMTRHMTLVKQRHHPLLAEAAGWIGHAAIRTRGTLGGSLAHADPTAELPLVAVATDAVVTVQGPSGRRQILAGEVFDGVLQTTLEEGEILTEVDLAVPNRWGFAELARRHGDFGLVIAVVAELDDGWRVVVGGVDSVPHRCTEAEAQISAATGPVPVDAVAATAAAGVQPSTDLHASAAYRRAMTQMLVARALRGALKGGPRT